MATCLKQKAKSESDVGFAFGFYLLPKGFLPYVFFAFSLLCLLLLCVQLLTHLRTVYLLQDHLQLHFCHSVLQRIGLSLLCLDNGQQFSFLCIPGFKLSAKLE